MNMNMTKHAQIRQQQRGIPPIVIDLLIEYGTEASAGSQATKYYFDKAARKRLNSYVGRLTSLFSEYLDYYAVVGADGAVITAAPRIKKINH
jgi:hypothetical protein